MAEEAAPLGSERLDLSALAHLVVVGLLRVPAHLVVVGLPPALAHVVEAQLRVPAHLVVVELPPALAHVVVEAQLLQLLRSQSLSASTARNSLSPVRPTYERAPSSR